VMGLSPQLHIAPKGLASRIAIRAGKKILFIDSADIIAVEAEGHYVLLQHKASGYLLRESISTMAEKLSLFGFVRIHRSSLVNAAFVEEIQPLSTGEYVLRVRGGKKYTVTRTYKKNLHLLAESWIGTEGFDQIECGGLINSD
jgi:two-component system, LytTR family, response regulator